MRQKGVRLFIWFFIFLIVLAGGSISFLFYAAERKSRLDPETVLKLKQPIGPTEAENLLSLTKPVLGPPSPSEKPRVVIVGMDGLDHQYLDPLIQKGKLPNFKRLAEEGARGTLLSILPPSSAGAWPSMVTGCGPGKTNLLNFRTYDALSKKVVLTDGQYLRRPALWDILGLYGKKSVVINDPMSYPPRKIQGVMVSGLLAPEGKIFTYPEGLSSVLDEIGYQKEALPQRERMFTPQFAPKSTHLRDVLLTEEKRLEVALLLMKKTDWDLFFCMFPSTDRIMHRLGENFRLRDLEENLVALDKILGAFLDELPEGATFFLVSDHGFDFYPKQFSIPRWLEKEGYWFLPRSDQPKKTPVFQSLKFLKKLKEKTDLPDIPLLKWPRALQQDELQPPLDWERSVAISVETGGNWGSIRILKKDLKETLVKGISEKLSQLSDPKTGEKEIRTILKGDEVYAGPYRERMPDLVFEFSRARADFGFRDEIVRRAPTYNHRKEGVLFAWGRGVRKNASLTPGHVTDIAPTVLSLLELPIARDLDGRFLETLFDPSYSMALKRSRKIAHYPLQKMEWVGISEMKKASPDVEEALRSLGYLQ